MLDLKAIYSESKVDPEWQREVEALDDSASVLTFDHVIGLGIEDLEMALKSGDLEGIRSVARGLNAVSEAFGGASWVLRCAG